MLKLSSKFGFVWRINNQCPISTQDQEFIVNLNLQIYHNDLESYLWAFDTKLPSGKWLENIRFSYDLNTIFAYIGDSA